MAAAEFNPRIAVDEAGCIDQHVYCGLCGADQLGARTDGSCLTCGASIESACDSRFLWFADPLWRRGLSTGLTCLLVGTAINFFARMVSVAFGLSNRGTIPGVPVVQLVAMLCCVFGIWRLTRSEPDAAEESWSPSRVTRICLGAWAAMSLAVLYPWPFGEVLQILVHVISLSLIVICLIALTIHVSAIAIRLADAGLVRWARCLLVAYLLISVVGTVISAVIADEVSSMVTEMNQAASIEEMKAAVEPRAAKISMMKTVLAGFIVAEAIWIGTLFFVGRRFQNAFRRSAEYAEQTWAADRPAADESRQETGRVDPA